MKHYVKMKGGDEYDGLSQRAKKFYNWRPGQRKAIKKQYNKRERRTLNKKELDIFEEE